MLSLLRKSRWQIVAASFAGILLGYGVAWASFSGPLGLNEGRGMLFAHAEDINVPPPVQPPAPGPQGNGDQGLNAPPAPPPGPSNGGDQRPGEYLNPGMPQKDQPSPDQKNFQGPNGDNQINGGEKMGNPQNGGNQQQGGQPQNGNNFNQGDGQMKQFGGQNGPQNGGQQNNNQNGGQGGQQMMPQQGGQGGGNQQNGLTDAQQAAQDAAQLKNMKKNMKSALTNLKSLSKRFDLVTAKGMTVPSDCRDALTTALTAMTAGMAATTIDEVQEAGIQDVGNDLQTLNDCRGTVDMLSRLPTLLKQVDRDITKLDKSWNSAKKGAPADLSGDVSNGDALMADIKASRAKVSDLLKTGDVETIQNTIQDDIYGKFDDINAAISKIGAMKNAKKFLSAFPARYKSLVATVKQMKKAGEDTTDFEDTLSQAQDKFTEIKTLTPGSDEYTQAVMDLADLNQQLAGYVGGAGQTGSMFAPTKPSTPAIAPMPMIAPMNQNAPGF